MYKKMRKNGKGKEENEEKLIKLKKKMKKGKGEMSNVIREKELKEAEDFFVLFCFVFLLFTFRKPLKLFRGPPKWKFPYLDKEA